MKRLNHNLSPKIEADLQRLIEPLASYIAAVGHPNVVLIVVMTLLLDSLREINEAAHHHLNSLSENNIG